MASKFTITAELSLQTKNLNQVVKNLQSQFNNANLNIKIKDLAQAQSHIQKISANSKQASKDVGVLGNSMEQAFKRFTVITAVTGTLIAFTRAIKNSVGEAISFEREVVKIAQATGKTASQLKGLTDEIDFVSTTFGVASKELILASRSLTQAGFAADKVAGALRILAQTELAATFDSIQDTTEGAIALLNQFGREAQRAGTEVKFLEQSFSAINQVSKEFAVESSDLVTAIRTTGGAFEAAGGDLNELLALFTSVRSTTRESAESIATGFRTIFTRVQRVDTINALRNLGIELQDAEGKFIGPMEAIKRLSTALNTIDPKDFRFNLVVEELGGFRQVSKVIPLIQQFAVTQQALNVAQGSSGSLAKDAQTAQQSLAVQIAKTKEEFQKFIREMVATDTFQSTIRTLLDLAGAFIRVADSVKPLIPLVATFAAFKAGSALVPALRSFAGSGKRGGVPIGFAGGGMVPGSGNGDTVPAMLTPGEFVIKKASVNKIGAANLANINKYADGGRVTLIPKANRYGIFALEPEGESDKDNYSTGVKVKNKDVADKLKSKLNIPKDSDVAIGGFLKSFSIDNDAHNNIRQTFKDSTNASFAKMITDVSNDVSKKVGSDPINIESSNLKSAITSLFNQDSKSARSAIEGYVLEGVSSAISGAELAGGQERWDFPNPSAAASGLSKLFGKEQEIAALSKADVKRTDNTEARSDVRSNKLANTLLENPEEISEIIGNRASKALKEKDRTSANEYDNFRSKIIATLGKDKLEFAKRPDGAASLSSLNLASGSGTTDLIKGILGSDTPAGFGKNNFNLNEANKQNILDVISKWKNDPPITFLKKHLGGTIQKFASGGFASGSDTVPAMLTPGEFVVNKKSAQKIGYSSLNRMNKVGKYAQGGFVKMASGGSVPPTDPFELIMKNRIRKMMEAEKNNASGYQLLVSGKTGTPDVEMKKFLNMLKKLTDAGKDATEFLKTGYGKISAAPGQYKVDQETKDLYSKLMPKGSKKEEDEYLAKLKEMSEGSSHAITNFLLMAGAAETVISQFSSLSEANKAMASAFGASLAIYSGISSQLKAFGTRIYASIYEAKRESASRALNSTALNLNTNKVNQNTNGRKTPAVEKLEKTFSILDGALAGFSVGMAASAAVAAKYAKEAEIASKNMSDTVNKFKEDFKSVSRAELGSSIKNAFFAESKSKMVGERLSSKESVAGIGSSALIGAYIGATFGPFGAAIGGVVGGLAGMISAQQLFIAQFSDSKDKIADSASSLADTLYKTSESIISVKKFLEDLQSKNLSDVFQQTSVTVSEYLDRIKTLSKSEKGLLEVHKTFGEMPEVLKNTLDDAASGIGQLKNEIDKLIGANLSKKIQDIGSKIGTDGFSVTDDIKAFVEKMREGIVGSASGAVQQRYSRTVQGFKAQNLDTKDLESFVKTLAKSESEKAILEFTKQMSEAAMQTARQNLVMSQEIKIRENLLGVLSKQLALESGISNISYLLEKNSNVDGAYSGTMSGLKSNSVSSAIIDVIDPSGKNKADFDKAMQIVSDFSPLAKNVQQSAIEFGKFSPTLDMILGSIDFKQFEGGKEQRDVAVQKMLEGFGVNLSSEAGKGIAEVFDKSFNVGKTGAKEGGYTREERQNLIKSNFEEGERKAKETVKKILDISNKIESATREYRDKILQSQQKEVEMRISAVDAQQSYFEMIQKASTGKGLSLFQSETGRFAKQRLLAGDLAGNPKAIGEELTKVRNSLKAAGLSDAQKQGLQSKAKKLEMALADLANQSSRTSDIMSKIDEFRAQRETVSDAAKDYAFGTTEEKSKMDQSFNALRTVVGAGDINSIPDEMKSSVREILSRFKDVPLFNGMTGFQVENELTAREMEKGGNFDIAAMLRNQTSSPEQMLINELKKTANVEMAARAQMLAQEAIYQQDNTNAIINLTAEIKAQQEGMLQKEKDNNALIAKQQNEFGKAPDEAKLKKEIEDLEKVVKDTTEKLVPFKKSIEDVTTKINDEIIKLSTPVTKQSVSGEMPMTTLASGGLIYRAGGGTIFKPKGTDTVPAMLTPGEFVMRKSSVDKIGVKTLEGLNKNGTLFAANGSLVKKSKILGNPKILGKMSPYEKKQKEDLIYGDSFKNTSGLQGAVGGHGQIRGQLKQIIDGAAIAKKRLTDQGYSQEDLSRGLVDNADMDRIIRANSLGFGQVANKRSRDVLQKNGGYGFSASSDASPLDSPEFKTMGPKPERQRRRFGGQMSSMVAQQNKEILNRRYDFNRQVTNGVIGPNTGFKNVPPSPLNNETQKFGDFINRFEEAAKSMNGMTMTHHLTVDGQLNIAGVDGNAIAVQISQALGQYVGNIVQQHLNKQNRKPGT